MKKNNDGRYIMIVDDDPDNFIIVGELLRVNGIEREFQYCADGLELIDALHNGNGGKGGNGKNKPKPSLPELILLDLNMPGMDGRQALKIIRKNQKWRHIPVIVLTSSMEPQDMDYCFQAGANAFINKSQDFRMLVDHLIDTVKSCMGKSDRSQSRMHSDYTRDSSARSA